MRRLGFVRVAPGLLALAVLALLPACSDDTKPGQHDLGVKLDGKRRDGGAPPDRPLTSPEGGLPDKGTVDKGKTLDQSTKLDKGTTGDQNKKIDQGKTPDGKVDGPKVDAKKADGPKTDGSVTPPPANAKCATPKTLTLTAGIAIEAGSTAAASDEFPTVDCGSSTWAWEGPQVYYKVNLPVGKKYKALLVAPFDAALYAFPAATACTAAAINTACASPTPASPDNVYNSDTSGNELVRIAPAATTDWIIVVDSYDVTEFGIFTLTVSEVSVPGNTKCATPRSLTLSGTPATVVENADTSDAVDEFATVACGNSSGPWAAPQLYYKVKLTAGKKYKVLLDSTVDGALYAFPAATACTLAAINTACTSPTPADPLNVYSSDSYGGLETVRLAPAATGDWIVVVDAYGSDSGPFKLTVMEFTPPTNGACTTAQAVALTTSPVTVNGDSSDSSNQFGQTITCGGSYNYDGNQLYYRLPLAAGKTYTIVVTPGNASWDPALYAFTDATCTAATIETQCSATTPNLLYVDDGTDGAPETLTITAPATPATTDTFIAVDTFLADSGGPFSLKISW